MNRYIVAKRTAQMYILFFLNISGWWMFSPNLDLPILWLARHAGCTETSSPTSFKETRSTMWPVTPPLTDKFSGWWNVEDLSHTYFSAFRETLISASSGKYIKITISAPIWMQKSVLDVRNQVPVSYAWPMLSTKVGIHHQSSGDLRLLKACKFSAHLSLDLSNEVCPPKIHLHSSRYLMYKDRG